MLTNYHFDYLLHWPSPFWSTCLYFYSGKW